MITKFIQFLNKKNIQYCVTNGYQKINAKKEDSTDYDILFTKLDFKKINLLISEFCQNSSYILVQELHQEVYAKNFFLYDITNNNFLNLDLYGELTRHCITILNEELVFSRITSYQNIKILYPADEFIQYFIKKIDKLSFTIEVFKGLKRLYHQDERLCEKYLKKFFQNFSEKLIKAFINDDFLFIKNNLLQIRLDFSKSSSKKSKGLFLNYKRILKRIINPTGLAITFLGPDGSGKSTIIKGLLKQNLPFRRNDYFHLKPIKQNQKTKSKIVENPHKYKPYGFIKSVGKLLYFVYQYNMGWLKNIYFLKIKSSLVIFDRYFDDILVDNLRYRYSAGTSFVKIIRYLIPKPKLYFILVATPEIIHKRKQEVSFEELERQILLYRSLGNQKKYFVIDVNRTPKEIVQEVTSIIMHKMNERY